MKQSQLFYATLKEDPRDATTVSQKYLMRGGYTSQLAAGVWTLMPLGWLVAQNIIQIIREEMNEIDGQELLMPAMQPKELWEESGRWETFEPPLFRFTDRHGKEYALGPTHEDVVTDLARRYIQSYKQLPLALYQIQTKFRNEQRPTGGLLRVREFIMNDLYSFHASTKDLDDYYQRVRQAYDNIFRRCGVKALAVEASSGSIGGSECHEYMILADSGEDTVVMCKKCNYAANLEQAKVKRATEKTDTKEKTLSQIDTGDDKTIQALSHRLKIKAHKTLKAVFYIKDEKEFIFVVIRGDRNVNETKLLSTLQADTVRLATGEEVSDKKIIAGQASPVKLAIDGITIIGDESIQEGSNFVVGANIPGQHYVNANYPRDFEVDQLLDISNATENDNCLLCGSKVELHSAIEAGHIFKLGTVYSEKMKAEFIDQDGKGKPIIMGCYGIGVGRLLASIIEASHDDRGIIWPPSVSPFKVHLLVLGNEKKVSAQAEKTYLELKKAGVSVLFDNRDDISPGQKFAESDLLGIPLRLVISRKTENMIELKERTENKPELLNLADVIKRTKHEIS